MDEVRADRYAYFLSRWKVLYGLREGSIMADPVTMAIGNLALGVFSGQMKGEATRLAIAEQTEANNDMAAEYRADIKGANQLYADAKTNTDFAQKTIMGGMKDIAAENKYAVGLTAQKG